MRSLMLAKLSQRGRDEKNASRAYAKPGDIAHGLPVVVLINLDQHRHLKSLLGVEGPSAGGSSGTRSFGKGSVQSVIPVSGTGAMQLTTARYYTPSGVSIQATGITPHIEVALARIEELEVAQRAKKISKARLIKIQVERIHLDQIMRRLKDTTEEVDRSKLTINWHVHWI